MLSKKIYLVAATSSLALMSVFGAKAQTAPASAQGEAKYVQEVVVTAQKRPERLIDVPASVAALSGQELVDSQADHFTDYLSRVPNVSFYSQQEGYTQPQIRGIATGANSSTTGIYIDETPYGSSTGYASGGVLTPDLDPDDLTRIEVLSGPQGTLYGANSLGGLIKYVTTPPNLKTYSARLSAEYSGVDGGGDGYAFRGMVNIPIVSDQLALRISAYDRRDPGYIKNIAGPSNEDATDLKGLRAQLLWKPTDKLTISGLFLLQDLKNDGEPTEDVTQKLTPIYGPLTEKRIVSEIGKDQNRVASVSIGYDFGWANLLSTSSYSTFAGQNRTDRNNDGTPQSLDAGFGGTNLGGYMLIHTATERATQEIRLTSQTGHFLEWQAGFYYDYQRNNQDQPFQAIDLGTLAPVNFPFSIYENKLLAKYWEYAGYADIRLNLTRKFDVLFGGRYSTNHQTFTLDNLGVAQPDDTLTRTSSDNSFTWLVNPRYKFNDNLVAYGRFASGYNPGGPNPVVPGAPASVPLEFGPETIVSYEGGLKGTFLDGRADASLALFYIDWSDIQLGTDICVGQLCYFVDENSGKATSKGVEFTSSYSPIRGLSLSGSVGYVDATLAKDAPGIGGVKGDRLARVPNVNAAIGANYSWVLAHGWRAFAGGNWRYVGDAYSDYSNSTTRVLIPEYNVLDLRAGVYHGPVELTVFAKNLNNSRGITNINIISPQQAGIYNYDYDAASIIQPRTFGISVTGRF